MARVSVSRVLLASLLCGALWLACWPVVAGEAAKPAAVEPEFRPKTGGFSVEEAWTELKRQMEAGGTTNWVIVFLSLVGVAFILERAFRLRRKYIVPAGLSDKAAQLSREGQWDEIAAMCESPKARKTALAQILAFLVRHRTAPMDQVSSVAGDIASRHLDRHSMLNYPILTVATVAPLLGLFGTVVGMIEAFDTVTSAGQMGDPRMLSSSISKALITTEFGLAVAIPTVFFYAMYRLRTSYLFNILEEEVSALIAAWFIKADKEC